MAVDGFTRQLVTVWVRAAVEDLADARAEIDRLNVFPVPDGDTGTNMYLTMEAGLAAVLAATAEAAPADEAVGDPVAEAAAGVALAQVLVRGAMLGARGNSGVILSQILRGLLRANPEALLTGGPGALIASSMRNASRMAYEAVGNPIEGTILTVMRVAAESATRAAEQPGATLASVVEAAAEGAHDALQRTPQMLPALAEAGVVDSGGRGLTVLLDALVAVVTGEPRPPRALPEVVADALGHAPDVGYTGPDYEVMYLLDAPDDELPGLRARLGDMGDSLVVVGGEQLWNVHVHVDDAGAAIEAAMQIGRPYRIRVTWLRGGGHPGGKRRGRRLVAVAHGPGVAQMLGESDVVVVPAEPGVSTSTGELLEAVQESGAAEIIILPASKDVIPAAKTAADRARAHGVRVAVVPTRAVVQSLAAVAVHDPDRDFDDDVAAMSRAAGATRYGAVTIASREAITSAGVCRPGDVLGLISGDIVLIGDDERVVARQVLARMLGVSGELVTLVRGRDATMAGIEELAEDIEDAHPGLDVVVVDGGQPLWPVIIGVE